MAKMCLDDVVRCLKRTALAARTHGVTDRALLERYLAQRDQEAFEAILVRHGPRVFAMCRQVLSDAADIDDAFQATFLVLLDKARRIRWQDSLGNWLSAVAHRIAVRALARGARRSRQEARAHAPAKAAGTSQEQLLWSEACGILHEELDRLPDKFRLPLLLCYLDGLSRDEAARRLGWSLGSVKAGLERGRTRLRQRLQRRGITLSAGLLAAVGSSVTAGGPPLSLMHAVLRAAAGTPVPSVAALVYGAVSMKLQAKLAVGLLLAVTLGVGLGTATGPAPIDGKPANDLKTHAAIDTKNETPVRSTPVAEKGEARRIRGRVLTPDGTPVANAVIYQCQHDQRDSKISETKVATTGPDGRFEVEARELCTFIAAADGFAPDCIRLDQQGDEVTLTLAHDTPIHGRLLDLQGKPLSAVKVRVLAVSAPGDGNLQGAYDAFRLNPEWTHAVLPKRFHGGAAGTTAAAKTDADGRFELKGLGRGRVAELRFEADTIEAAKVYVFTVPNFDTKLITPSAVEKAMSRFLPDYKPAVYGPTFTHVVQPCHVIAGGVTDAVTGKPVAGVKIVGTAGPAYGSTEPAWNDAVHTTTDAAGRFLLSGLPKARQRFLHVQPGDNPYLDQLVEVKDIEGLAPVTVDIKMHRCVVVEGRLIDKTTGKPVKGQAHYLPMEGNEALKSPDARLYRGGLFTSRPTGTWVFTGDDGRFRLRVPWGAGLVLARADQSLSARYTAARATPADKKYLRPPYKPGSGIIQAGPKSRDDEEYFQTANLIQPLRWENGYALIDAAAHDHSVTLDIRFEAGLTVSGKVVAPDGAPLAGAKAVGVQATDERQATTFRTDTFTAHALDPDRPRDLFFLHEARKLAGTLTIQGNVKDAPVMRMQPWAAVTGRVLDHDGTPVAGVHVTFQLSDSVPDEFIRQKLYRASRPVQTDRDGRFRLEGLFPGHGVTIHAHKPGHRSAIAFPPLTPNAGAVEDLGDVRFRDPRKTEGNP